MKVMMRSRKHYVLVCCAMVLLQACGGNADSPGAAAATARWSEWSPPQLGKVTFDNRSAVTAHADSCGGISFLGTTASSWLAQRFSPSSGWQNAMPYILDGLTVQGGVQRIDVGGVPHVFYRDAKSWYRVHFDCTLNSWQSSLAFPVEYRLVSGQPDVAIEVNFSEAYDHSIIAARASADGSSVVLSEWHGAAWSQSVSVIAWSSATDRVSGINSVSVVRAKDTDAAWISFSSGLRYLATRGASLQDFRPITPPEGCLGHFCVGRSAYSAPRLELDGSATVSFSGGFIGVISDQDWYRVDPSGLTSLWGSARTSASANPLLSIVRPDGGRQWWASGSLDVAQGKATNGSIIENGVEADWSHPFEYERMECYTAGCRVFSTPEPSHLVTIVDGFANLAPTKTSYLAISDRSTPNNWIGTYSMPLTQLLAEAPGAQVPPEYRWPANGMVEVVKFHASDQQQIVAALVNRKASGMTPLVLWKQVQN
jgi:hypothetical protein